MKLFNIDLDIENEELGMDAISLVENPAVGLSFLTFNNESKSLCFTNDEQHIITGVVMLANTPIYRYSKEDGEYYIQFTRETIKTMILKYFKSNLSNSVNLEHNNQNFVDGAVMVESYLFDTERGITPKEFVGKVTEGSWICSFKITNEELWKEIKDGTFKGFSLQGMFSFKKVTDDYKPKEQDWSWLDDYITD